MALNQFCDFINLNPDPYSSNFVNPDTINPDPHHQCFILHKWQNVFDKKVFLASFNDNVSHASSVNRCFVLLTAFPPLGDFLVT